MANGLTGLSTLKRIRSSSTSTSAKKESKINTILNKLAASLYGSGSNNKKRRQEQEGACVQRKSSAGHIIDYFRSTTISNNDDHPFANDALFEQNRYKQQKKLNNESMIVGHHSSNVVFDSDIPLRANNSSIATTTTMGGGILLNKTHTGHHRHHPSATSFLLKSSEMNKKKPYHHHRHTHSTPPAMTTKPTAIISPPTVVAAYTAAGQSKSSSSNCSSSRKNANTSNRHIRHYSHVSCISSSNITVNSEDLTAKEFADIAGIRILSEEEEGRSNSNHNTYYSYYDAVNNQSVLSKKFPCSVCGGGEGDDYDKLPSLIVPSSRLSSNISSSHHHHHHHHLSHSGITHSSLLLTPSNNNSTIYATDSQMLVDDEDEEMSEAEPSQPQIWDDDFWRLPNSKQQQDFLTPTTNTTNKKLVPIIHNTMTSKSNTLTAPPIPAIPSSSLSLSSKISFKEKNNNDSIESPPIVHELKKQHAKSYSFSAGQNGTTAFIKRGRFEIHLSDDNYSTKNNYHKATANPIVLKKPEMVVEWKRKVRPTPTNSSITTTAL